MTRINIHIGARSLVNLYGKCVTPQNAMFHQTINFKQSANKTSLLRKAIRP